MSELSTSTALNIHLKPLGFRINLPEMYDQWDIHCLTCRENAGLIPGVELGTLSSQGLVNRISDIMINHVCWLNEFQNVAGTFGLLYFGPKQYYNL